MKKFFSIITFLFCALSIHAQYFSLTESGLKPANGKDKNFIVIEKEGKSQKDLFNQVKNFITSSYVSPKDVISVNETEMITLNGISDGDVQCKKGFVMLPFRTNYTIVFMFKDGKIRINNPSINSMLAESETLGGQTGSFYQLTLSENDPVLSRREQIVVFKKNGKTTKGAKESIETFFNSLIDRVINFNSETEDW